MMYLTGCANPKVRAHAQAHGDLGLINTPNTNYKIHDWPAWAADNGAFNAKTYVGDEAWFAWLKGKAEYAGNCLFATAPDVVGDARATLDRSLPWLPRIRVLGFKAALVAQDGLGKLDVPWDAFDVLFIGGTTEFKLGPEAAQLCREARRRGVSVHMGRVNSFKRLRYAADLDCDTADGTFLAFGPDANLSRLRAWFDKLAEPTLFETTPAHQGQPDLIAPARTPSDKDSSHA
jgi:hypothetical protein